MSYFISERIKPTFGGHEKFVFRSGWLKKGVEAIKDDDLIFSREDALVTLGVGKNMGRSIRHWCLATNLLKEKPHDSRIKPLEPSELAKKLILIDAWDPFMEDFGTLWLIHWQLVSNPRRALVWSIIFSAFFDTEFSKKQLISFVTKRFEQIGVRTTEGTIEREVDCCLRTYVTTRGFQKEAVTEESLDCPLAELDVIQSVPGENLYRFNIGPKPTLPSAVFGFSLFRYLSKLVQSRRTITVDEILYQYGSPGQAFKLDENSVIEHLEQLELQTGGDLQLNETAGLKQIYLQESIVLEFTSRAYNLLGEYYGCN